MIGSANAAALLQMQMNDLQQRQYWGGGGGCCCPGPGFPYPINTYHGNLPNATVGTHGCWLFQQPTQGYGLDLNNNGRYDAGRDGVLAFDLNRDGRITPDEIKQSKDRLNAFGGNFDFNNDGRVDFCERMRGQRLQGEMQQRDLNRDGRLDANEIDQAGGRVLVDGNRDGKFQPWESYSPYNFPTPGFGRGSLNFVDPRNNYTSVNHGWGWAHPPYYR